jgi:hypothetical protein
MFDIADCSTFLPEHVAIFKRLHLFAEDQAGVAKPGRMCFRARVEQYGAGLL